MISHEDEKQDVDIELNKGFAPKIEKGYYGPKDYLCNLELSTAPLNSNFVMTSFHVSSHDGRTDSQKKTKHQYIQDAFIRNYKGARSLYQVLVLVADFDDMFGTHHPSTIISSEFLNFFNTNNIDVVKSCTNFAYCCFPLKFD